MLCLGNVRAGDGFKADLIIRNAKVWTVDISRPEAQAVASWKGRILAVGDNEAVNQYADDRTTVIDAKGMLVLPGFNDNHTHFVPGGLSLREVQLKDTKSHEEFGERLAAKSKELPKGAWITGGSWDHDNWPGGELPTAELLDKYVPDRPVLIERYDGHMAVANSMALRMAGVNAETPDPAGGVIVRKPGSKEPAGVLKDAAANLVSRIIPDASFEEEKDAARAAIHEANRFGVTSLTDMSGTPSRLRIYQELLHDGELTVRIDMRIPLSRWQTYEKSGILANFSDNNWIKIGGLKGFVDGSLGSSTALFFEPYVQDPTTSGVHVTPLAELEEQIIAADKAGLHVAIHAIGDKANSDILDIFEKAIKVNGPRDRRFRVEHAQHIHPKDFERYAKLGVIACVQPYHTIDDGRWAEGRIGHDRCKSSYAYQWFEKTGVLYCFGTDWTVAPLNPILGIDAAVTRRTLDGRNPNGWFPEEKITAAQAIRAYTYMSAYATFDENIKGTITSGKLADMVIVDRDILAISPDDIPQARVVCTIVDG
ncbi:amidohydrolase, partial [Candidatus Sumerlaeota bacterium]|nr:amidohydrolase [Candidatus Sumerlaeota bacterium]